MIQDALETAATIGLIRPATFIAAVRAGLITYQHDKQLRVVPTYAGKPLTISNDADISFTREPAGTVRQLRRAAP